MQVAVIPLLMQKVHGNSGRVSSYSHCYQTYEFGGRDLFPSMSTFCTFHRPKGTVWIISSSLLIHNSFSDEILGPRMEYGRGEGWMGIKYLPIKAICRCVR